MVRISCSLLLLIVICWSCFEEKFETGGGVTLEFSVDTLRFDTVFTRVGSATRALRIFNPSDLPVKTSVSLDDDSRFRMNVDGVSYPGGTAGDVEIWGKDSIYIFVEVTIDPDQPLSASPFVITEFMSFETNGHDQRVTLEAWGQNANYIPRQDAGGQISILSCDLGQVVWDDPRPYVIFGLFAVDSCELVWPAGTQVYVHGGIANNDIGVYNDGIVWILENGRLKIHGSLEEPVLVQGDRTEPEFEEIAGQWTGIRLGAGSKGNEIRYATIKNAIVGVRVDSTAELNMRNTIVRNTTGSGIIGVTATMQLQNCLIHTNGGFGLQLVAGGDYRITYCTVASYGNQAEAMAMTNFQCLTSDCSDFVVHNINGLVRNSVLIGNSADELNLVDATGMGAPAFDVRFRNNIVRVDELLENPPFENFLDRCSDCIQASNEDTLFVDRDGVDFHLDSLSIAIGGAQSLSFINDDLEGNERDDEPDIGCYERQN